MNVMIVYISNKVQILLNINPDSNSIKNFQSKIEKLEKDLDEIKKHIEKDKSKEKEKDSK